MTTDLILGDNQFFGVNHMSQEKGEKTSQYFRDSGKLKEIMHFAVDSGMSGLMLSTNERIGDVVDLIRKDKSLSDNLLLYPNIPYVAKYVRYMNELGPIGTIRHALKSHSSAEKVGFLLDSGLKYVRKDYLAMFLQLVDLELIPFRGLRVGTVFLHNVVVDLLAALGLYWILDEYIDHIRTKHGVGYGIGTLNYGLLSDNFTGTRGDIAVLTPVNKLGLYMNPSRQAVEQRMSDPQKREPLFAMSVLAGGRLKPQEASEYLRTFEREMKVVVGYSTVDHGKQLIDAMQTSTS